MFCAFRDALLHTFVVPSGYLSGRCLPAFSVMLHLVPNVDIEGGLPKSHGLLKDV